MKVSVKRGVLLAVAVLLALYLWSSSRPGVEPAQGGLVEGEAAALPLDAEEAAVLEAALLHFFEEQARTPNRSPWWLPEKEPFLLVYDELGDAIDAEEFEDFRSERVGKVAEEFADWSAPEAPEPRTGERYRGRAFSDSVLKIVEYESSDGQDPNLFERLVVKLEAKLFPPDRGAVAYVYPRPPLFSPSRTETLVEFSFGPSAHGAIATYFLRCIEGEWRVAWGGAFYAF